MDKFSTNTVTRTVTYYPGGAMRINSTLYYVLKDQLGSASVVTNASGNAVGEQRYYPFGETRLSTGTMLTDKLFTSQRNMTDLGIYHYGARFYSPKLGHFLSVDTIVPNPYNPQDLNRFSYVRNNPLRYIDPTGHRLVEDYGNGGCSTSGYCPGSSGSPYTPTPTDGGEQTDVTEGAETAVEDLLLSNPKFDPFICKYSAESDCIYPGSDMEKVDLAFLKLYQDHGIDLDYYALRGLPNPLQIDQVPTELQWTLPGNGSYPITLFLKELENKGGNRLWEVTSTSSQNFMNYEPNYVFHLMLTHPRTLADTIEIVNNMHPGQYEQFNNTSPVGPQ